MFKFSIQVPDNLVAATPAFRKKCSKARGTAGSRRIRLLKEFAKQKEASTSKLGYVDGPVLPAAEAPPAAVHPAAAPQELSGVPQAFRVPSPNIP